VRLHPERYRSRELAEVRRDAVGQNGEHRDAERFGRFRGDLLGQDAVDGQPEVAVLLGAAERQHGAVITSQVGLDLHPIHVADAHVVGPFRSEPSENIQRRRGGREDAQSP
jgi:hypothetical protein